jgi:hypothetical protein
MSVPTRRASRGKPQATIVAATEAAQAVMLVRWDVLSRFISA